MGCVTCGTQEKWFPPIVVRLQMDGLCVFLNEPLKDDFMSGYSQMAGLAAASLAGVKDFDLNACRSPAPKFFRIGTILQPSVYDETGLAKFMNQL